MLFPYLPFMVRDFHLTEDDSQIGYYAGYIASAFSLGQFISSFFWGWFSDRIGRKPVLLLGAGGTFLSVLFFGFSINFPMALAARCLAGMLNGNVGVAKVCGVFYVHVLRVWESAVCAVCCV